MREAGAEPPDHRTRSAGVETGEASRRTSQHRSSKCAALGMAVVLLPHPDRPFPGRHRGGGGVVWQRFVQKEPYISSEYHYTAHLAIKPQATTRL